MEKEMRREMKSFDALVPDPLSSDQQYNRFYHHDLPDLDDTELTDELNCLRPLLWGLNSEHWVRQRVAMLEAELKKRQIVSYQPRGHQKSKPTGVIPL